MKLKISIAVLSLLMTVTVINSYAASYSSERPERESINEMTEAQKKARLEEIQVRVNEIKDMDKSALSRAERKAIKKEVRDMRKESKEMKGGIYLSVGAVIIIILVLILIL